MASVQLGIPKRLIYIKNTNLKKIKNKTHNEKIVLINPVILKKEGLTKYWEACASCGDNMGLVERPYKESAPLVENIQLQYVNQFSELDKKSAEKEELCEKD